jgi:Flp pilus assembly protein TadG
MVNKFLRNISGNVGLMFGVAAIPLLIGCGVAVDMVRMNNANTILQAAADAAALAGATSKKLNNPVQISKLVNDFLVVNGLPKSITSGIKIEQGKNPQTGGFKVKVTGQFSTTLMSLAGIKAMDVTGLSEVNLGIQGMEVALVLDNTGSMAGAKLDALKTAAKNLISILETGKADYADLKFGLVPFSQYVNVGMPNFFASWLNKPVNFALWNGCVGSRTAPLDLNGDAIGEKYPAVTSGVCPTPIVPLTTNTATIVPQIDAMIAQGGTYIPGGVLWGWNVLSPDAPFTEGRTDAQNAVINGRKVMVVMTDGTNTISPTAPTHDGADAAISNANFTTMCASVKAAKIEIFTVLFEEPSPVIKGLMRDCASAPDHFFDATSGASLISSFEAIARKLSDVRLTQ